MKHLLIVALAVVFNAYAEENTGTSEATATAPADSGVIGKIDMRPSYQGGSAWDYHTENFAELGYKFDANRILSYRQEFNTNLYYPRNEKPGGVDPTAQGGFARGQIKNLWVSENNDWNLNWEGRLYLPTNSEKRDAGMITAVRNYGILTYKASDAIEISLFEVPIVHMYDRAGFGAKANPSFENRVYLDLFANLSDSWTFELPIMLNSTRNRSYSPDGLTEAGDNWNHQLWIYPELLYKIDPTYTVGVSYMSDYLMRPDLMQLTMDTGLEKGTYQLVFIANL